MTFKNRIPIHHIRLMWNIQNVHPVKFPEDRIKIRIWQSVNFPSYLQSPCWMLEWGRVNTALRSFYGET